MVNNRVGETIAVSIKGFSAQTYELYEAPQFGDFVRIACPVPGIYIVAIVADIRTAPIDPTRPVIARGANLEQEEDLYKENPHFQHVMRTQFEAIVVGYLQEGRPVHTLPPQSPRVQGFVYPCLPAEIATFTRDTGFVRLLLVGGGGNDLLAACLTRAAAAQTSSSDYLVGAGQTLLHLLAEDPNRLAVLLPLLSKAQAGPPPAAPNSDWGTAEQSTGDHTLHVRS